MRYLHVTLVFPQIAGSKGNGTERRNFQIPVFRRRRPIIRVKSRDNTHAVRLAYRANLRKETGFLARANFSRRSALSGTGSRYIKPREIFHDLFFFFSRFFAPATKDEYYVPVAIIQNASRARAHAQEFSFSLIGAKEGVRERGKRVAARITCHKWPETIWKLGAKVTRADLHSCAAVQSRVYSTPPSPPPTLNYTPIFGVAIMRRSSNRYLTRLI